MIVERFKHMISVWRFKKTIVERFQKMSIERSKKNNEC